MAKLGKLKDKQGNTVYPETNAKAVHIDIDELTTIDLDSKLTELEGLINNSGLTADNTTPYEVVDDYNPAHKEYVDTSISQAITEALEDKVTQEYVDTAIENAITGVLEGEV